MPTPIDFYFDFSSPYAYLASERIDSIASRHGREVIWRPWLMGAAMKITGSAPLVDRPMINDYSRHDLERCARLAGLPLRLPDPFPFAAIASSRAVYLIEREEGPAAAKTLARALFHASFGLGRSIVEAERVAAITEAAIGSDPEDILAGIAEPAIKERLKEVTDGAIAGGVFGSPFFLVDGEAFWGHDRLEQVDLWLERGGW
ncbi:2-hydroxychromene-2-carboxylate isomerase [Thioalkalivibrio sp. HK1]|uniref:2-hydroxychromene-2-carboxylate isomerase n=1 Tax=Thioalkalivibrio sp. HK1 TaxID=1469245 RepID=UPI0004726713|nr:2-hydroxychromene-2-carboxylate isomerase [Thioalkalivibrio sp. HK1]